MTEANHVALCDHASLSHKIVLVGLAGLLTVECCHAQWFPKLCLMNVASDL